MPVTKSAKRALRVSHRRAQENVAARSAYKKAVKSVRKAIETTSTEAGALFQQAQRALDTAAKNHTIHKNKAARLKSRLAKKMANTGVASTAAPKRSTAKKAAPKKAAAKKTTAKKAAPKKK